MAAVFVEDLCPYQYSDTIIIICIVICMVISMERLVAIHKGC